MIGYFNLNKACEVMKDISINSMMLNAPLDRVEDGIFDDIVKTTWLAALRPRESGMSAYRDDRQVYEEIQIIQILLKRIDNMFIIASTLMKTVKYPTILIIEYHDKYMICMAKVTINKNDKYSNVVRGFVHTSWLFASEQPIYTQKIISKLNTKQYLVNTLYELYSNLFNELLYLKGLSLSKAHVWELLSFYRVSGDAAKIAATKDCDVYKFFRRDGANPAMKYKKRNSNSSTYIWQYDYEDLWQSLIKNIPDVFSKKGLITMGHAIKYMCEHQERTVNDFKYYELLQYLHNLSLDGVIRLA